MSTLASPETNRNARTHDTRPKKSQRWVDPIAVGLHHDLGCSVLTAEKIIRLSGSTAAAVIRVMRIANADVRLEHYFADIRAAYENRVAKPLTPELSQWANEADQGEENAVLKFWQTNSDRDLSLAIRAKDVEIARAIAERDAMIAEEQRRMRLA